MKRGTFILASLLFAATAYGAPVDSLTLSKCNPTLAIRLQQAGENVASRAVGASVATDTLPVLVTCDDADRFVATLHGLGIKAYPITATAATARIPIDRMAKVAALDGVEYLESSHPNRTQLDVVRTETGADAMHAGEGLESPFTGKGVIVGIIDRGFEYNHPAFTDSAGHTRIVGLWDRFRNEEAITDAALISQRTGDGFNDMHGGHVAGIAVGSHVSGHVYGGMAPDADIILTPGELQNEEVLESFRYIRDEAAKAGKPFVVNMSLGSQYGPHDGTNSYVRALDELVGAGALNVVAIGNDAQNLLHASDTLFSAGDTLFLPIDQRYLPTSYAVLLYIWSEREAQTLPTVSYYVYHVGNKTLRPLTRSEQGSLAARGIRDEFNGKYSYLLSYPSALSFLDDQQVLCVALTGGDEGQIYHAWTHDYSYGSFLSAEEAGELTAGDHFYMAGSFSDSRRSLAIGAWCAKKNFVALNGSRRTVVGETQGNTISTSNFGPVLGDFSPKPLVCAPGGVTVSAYSKLFSEFSESSNLVVDKVERDGDAFYYGAAYGTSMSTPVVTGAIACWLQAYPELTPEEAIDIIAETAVNDAYTGDARDNWHLQWGYGKFDAYAGLKVCIAKAQALGVNAPLGEQPFTLSRGTDVWRVCFNQPVSRATLVVTAADGSVRMQRVLSGVATGHEETIALHTFTPGVYLVHLEADGVKWTRKFAR